MVGPLPNRILEAVNYELETYTLGDWVNIFEVCFSLRIQQHRQRFPQATRSLLARPLWWTGKRGLCIVNDYCPRPPILLGFQTMSHRELCLVRLLCVLGLSVNRLESTGDKAALARSVSSSACPLALPTLLSGFPFSVCVEREASPSHYY